MFQSSDDTGGVVEQRWGMVEFKKRRFGVAKSKEKARNIMRDFCKPQNYQVVEVADYDISRGGYSYDVSETATVHVKNSSKHVRWRFFCVH